MILSQKTFHILIISHFLLLSTSYSVASENNPLINKLEDELYLSSPSQILRPEITRNILRTISRHYEASKEHLQKLVEIQKLQSLGDFPSQECLNLEELSLRKQAAQNNYREMPNLDAYVKQTFLNQIIKCSHDFEVEMMELRKQHLVDSEMLLNLREYVAANKKCLSKRTQDSTLLTLDVNGRWIPRNCLIDAFAGLLDSHNLSKSGQVRKLSGRKIRAQLNQILAVVKAARPLLEPMRMKFKQMNKLEPQFMEFNGYQTIGLLEVAFIADEKNLNKVAESEEEIVGAVKTGRGKIVRRILGHI